MIDNGNDGKNEASFINSLNKIFCNKECCADYIRFVLNKPKDAAEDDLNENVISNIELIKKSANKDYDKTKVPKNATDAPKPEEFLNNGKFSGFPDEIKSAYLEKYFEIIDGNRFDYEKSLADNLEDMLDRYKNYPEGVLLHILRLWFGNFETDINNKKNNGNDDFSSKKSLATAIKNILDSNNFGSDEKKLALLWEYYEYFNGIDENEKLVEGQNKVEQFKDAIEKITNSDDFMKNIESDSIAYTIITGKLRAYGIDSNFKKEYIEILKGYSAVIESFKSATPTCENNEATNNVQIRDICHGEDDYQDLSSAVAVRAKIIDRLSHNETVRGIFEAATTFDFIKYLKQYYQVDTENVSPEILVALFKLFLKSNPAVGADIGQVLTTMLQIQKNTEDFTEQANLDKKILCELSYDIREKFDDDLEKNELKQDKNRDNNIYDESINNIIDDYQNEDLNRDNDIYDYNENIDNIIDNHQNENLNRDNNIYDYYDYNENIDNIIGNHQNEDINGDNNIYDESISNIIGNHQNEDINRDNDDNDVPFSLATFFGKILFCLVFFIVAIPTLLIRWTLRFFWGISGWFINMFYCNWQYINCKGQGVKNLCWEIFGFFSVGLVGAVARRWFISDPLAICQIFQNLWYRFFGNADDINNHQVYVTGFIVWTGNRNINGKDIVCRSGSNEKSFGVGDYFKFMSGYSEVINKSEAEGYPDDNVPLQSKLENINTRDSSPLRYY